MQERDSGIGVPGHEDGQILHLQCLWVDGGQPAFVEGNAEFFQAQVFDVGHSAHRRNHLVHHHAVRAAAYLDPAGHFTQLRRCPGVQHHFGFEQGEHFGVQLRINKTRKGVIGAEGGHFKTQPRQGLRQLHTDRPHADHGNAGPQCGLLKQRVGGEHTVTEREPFLWQGGARACGNDDAACVIARAIDVHGCGAQDGRMARNARRAQVFCGLQRSVCELVAQRTHPLKHRRDVGREPLCATHSQFIENMPAMKGVGRFDEAFGRHAAHTGTRGAPGAFVDEKVLVGALLHLAQRCQACSACADDDGVERLAHRGTLTVQRLEV